MSMAKCIAGLGGQFTALKTTFETRENIFETNSFQLGMDL